MNAIARAMPVAALLKVAPPALLLLLTHPGDPVDATLHCAQRPQPGGEAAGEDGRHVPSEKLRRTRQRDERDRDGERVEGHRRGSIIVSTVVARPSTTA
jgi:hypothetical protein